MESPVRQPVGQFICFAVFDDNKNLLYTKYNFNFDLYISDKGISSDLTKNNVFNLFLDENETDVLVPFSVKPVLEQYFLPITEEIQQYFYFYNYILGDFGYPGNLTQSQKEKSLIFEFDLSFFPANPDGESFITLPELFSYGLYTFLFIESGTNLIFSKYNFNFTEYSNDFHIYGTTDWLFLPSAPTSESKIVVFSDFLFRYATIENALYPDVKGYTDMPEIFRKYFYLDNVSQANLKTHIEKYSIYSNYATVTNSLPNVNRNSYIETILGKYGINLFVAIGGGNLVSEYIIYYGQFQQDEVFFNFIGDEKLDKLTYSSCSVLTDDKFGSGMLYLWKNAPDSNYYENGRIILITTYHLISESNKNTLFANCYYNENTNLKLMFRIIGYDKLMDICIAMYDETLEYNQTYFPEDLFQINNTILPYCLTELNTEDTLQYPGLDTYIVGNPQLIDVSKLLTGKMINPNYAGTFTNEFILASPTTIMSDIKITTGFSGSPIYVAEYKTVLLSDFPYTYIDKINWVGMVNAMTGDNNQFSIGISGSLLNNAIQNALTNYADNIRNKPDLDQRLIQLLSQDLLTKKWLGVIFTYFNPAVSLNYNSAFRTFTFNRGIIIHKFILGFDTVNEVFLYDSEDLGTDGVILLNTPLLETQMYQRYLNSNKTPIIVKSMTFFDKISRVYKDFNFGKYTQIQTLDTILTNQQVAFDTFTYGLAEEAQVPVSGDYVNKFKNRYTSIPITYYWFNGKSWVLETEVFGGNDDSWFVEYTDNSGYKFLQHRFEFPATLLQYLQPFADTSEPYLSEDMPSDSQLSSKRRKRRKRRIPFLNSRILIQPRT
jgi:hypothetical protein